VIVDYLDVFGTRIGPSEHDPPLIVDADRVLTRQISDMGTITVVDAVCELANGMLLRL
jgi:hypothetical protein